MDTSKDIRELLFEVLDSEMEQTVDYSNVDALLQVFKEYIEEKKPSSKFHKSISMECGKCGRVYDFSTKYCSECGKKLIKVTSPWEDTIDEVWNEAVSKFESRLLEGLEKEDGK